MGGKVSQIHFFIRKVGMRVNAGSPVFEPTAGFLLHALHATSAIAGESGEAALFHQTNWKSVLAALPFPVEKGTDCTLRPATAALPVEELAVSFSFALGRVATLSPTFPASRQPRA